MSHSNSRQQQVAQPAPGSHTSRRELLALGGVGAGLAAGSSLAACRTAPASAIETPAEPLFPELSDQRHTVEPIAPAERTSRRARLARLLAERGVDAYFCEGGATLSYLTGVSWGQSERVFGLVLFADGSHVWVSPGFEAEKAALKLARAETASSPADIVTWEEDQYARHAFAEIVSQHRIRTLALDPSTRLLVRDEVRAAGLPDEAIVSGRAVLVALRGVKDEHELALLRRANELTQRAITAASRHVEIGMTGGEAAALMRSAQTALGLERVWVLALVGPAAAYPHGDDGAGRLGQGDFLLVDTGGSLHGYQSDITRTWIPHPASSGPGERELRVWNTVRDAQRRAFDAIRPGVACGAIDRAAREVIDGAGFGPDYRTFTHRLGHGIGMQGHEDPYFDRGSEVLLEPGMTLSNEPGIYLYGELGVRLEDIVAVTETGAEHFGNWQAGPLSPAVEAR